MTKLLTLSLYKNIFLVPTYCNRFSSNGLKIECKIVMKKTTHIKFKIIPLILSLFLISLSVDASKAVFDYRVTYKRNKKIWGTYKMHKEGMSVKRGKLSWKKFPKGRAGDLILSKGNFILLRETIVGDETKIIVDKIPYKKLGKDTYINKSPLEKEVFDRLLEIDIQRGISHRDLKEGEINYQTIRCKKKRGSLKCAIKGDITP